MMRFFQWFLGIFFFTAAALTGASVLYSEESGGIDMTEKAIFGAGCFWGVEAVFTQVPGVSRATSGYSGGHVANPTYQQVCTDKTGHAEVVEVEYDPQKVSYEQLVQYFFKLHDPTTLNRQGPDRGSQYRSVIFYHNDEQQQIAESVKATLDKVGAFENPIVTEISKAKEFYPAEDYHQKYYEKKGIKPTCHIL